MIPFGVGRSRDDIVGGSKRRTTVTDRFATQVQSAVGQCVSTASPHEVPMQELSSDFERGHGLPQFCVVRMADMRYSYSDSRDLLAAVTL